MKRQPSQSILRMPSPVRIALCFACCLVMSSVTLAEDWNQFRGPNSTGVSTENKPLPVEFSFEKNVLWSAELGRGIASPVIASGRVFETTMLDKQTFAVMAFDATSGKKLWQKEFPAGKLPEITPPNEHASSTPATDGDRVYVYFSTLGVMAFDANDGKLLWKHPVPHAALFNGLGAGKFADRV